MKITLFNNIYLLNIKTMDIKTCYQCNKILTENILRIPCPVWYSPDLYGKIYNFNFCDNKCFEASYLFKMSQCEMCNISLINLPNCIHHEVSRRDMNPYSIYLCGEECKNIYMKTKQCQICKCKGRVEIINGYSVCVDDNRYMSDPSCKQIYTGSYKCEYCKNEKNVRFDECYLFYCDNSEDVETLPICEPCMSLIDENVVKYTNLLNNVYNGWYKVIESLCKPDIINTYFNESNNFVCNKCHKIFKINIFHKMCNIEHFSSIHIINDLNICDNCYKLN